MLCTFGPPDKRRPYWILKFEDADMADMHFGDNEAEAIKAFRRYEVTWNCTLMTTAQLPNSRRPQTGVDDASCAHGDSAEV